MWKLKLDANGNAVLSDGKPVYVTDEGKEVVYDIEATNATISRLNGEAKTHREKAEANDAKLKTYEGIADPAAALKALTTVARLDEKKLVDAGERDQAVAAAVKATEEKYAPIAQKAAQLEEQLNQHLVGGAFARSKFVAEKFAAKGPAGVEIAQALFGSRLKVEGGKVVGYDAAGNKLYSKTKMGELADADEAIEMMVEAYPHKASLLAGAGSSGGGSQGGGSGGGGGKRTLSRAQFDALSPPERVVAAKEATITD